jgi:predicted ATPase
VNQWLSKEGLHLGYRFCARTAETSLKPGPRRLFIEGPEEPGPPVPPPPAFPSENHPQVIAYLSDEKRRSGVLAEDVGSGVSQVIPVLAAIALDRPITFIEQPELHMHPGLQAKLADFLLADPVKPADPLPVDGPRIIETHSEHLALRLLRRIRESSKQPRDFRNRLETEAATAFYYFQALETETQIHRIRVDSTGRFVDRWPEGFFEDRLEDLFS